MMERISDIGKTHDDASLHILVVEDNLDSQVLVCELLNVLGHRANGVASGEFALSALEQDAYDVLFTDISLPGMSGIELVRKVSETNPALKIIYASGYGAQVRKMSTAIHFRCRSRMISMSCRTFSIASIASCRSRPPRSPH